MDNTYKIEKIQKANLYMLKEIDKICKKHGINYALDSGTALGAVRHHGFIPWDDDVDIMMPREGWEIFKEEAPRELPEDLSLVTPMDLAKDGIFYDYTPRIMYLNSRRCDPDEESDFYYCDKINHLWVDIFILDKFEENRNLKPLDIFKQKAIYAFSMGHRKNLKWSKYKGLEKAAVWTLSGIGKLMSIEKLVKLQDDVSKKYQNTESENYYFSNYQPDWFWVTADKKWAQERLEVPFEDTVLPIAKDYDRILTMYYGDYLKLPDAEKRKPGHGTEEMQVYE